MGKQSKQSKKYLMEKECKQNKEKHKILKQICQGQAVNLLKDGIIEKKSRTKPKQPKETKTKNIKKTLKQKQLQQKFIQRVLDQKLPKPIEERFQYSTTNIKKDCPICNKQISKSNFSKHMKSIHIQTKLLIQSLRRELQGQKISCKICHIYLLESNLSRHYAAKHKGEAVQKNIKKQVVIQPQFVKMPEISKIMFFVLIFLHRFTKYVKFNLLQKALNQVLTQMIKFDYYKPYWYSVEDRSIIYEMQNRIYPHVLPKQICQHKNFQALRLSYLQNNNLVKLIQFNINSAQIKQAFEFLQFYKYFSVNEQQEIIYRSDMESLYNSLVIERQVIFNQIKSIQSYVLGYHKKIIRVINEAVIDFTKTGFFYDYVTSYRDRKRSKIQQQKIQKEQRQMRQYYTNIIQNSEITRSQQFNNKLQDIYQLGRKIHDYKITNKIPFNKKIQIDLFGNFKLMQDEQYDDNQSILSQRQERQVQKQKQWFQCHHVQYLQLVIERANEKRQRMCMQKQDNLIIKSQQAQDLTEEDKRRMKGPNRLNKFWKV